MLKLKCFRKEAWVVNIIFGKGFCNVKNSMLYSEKKKCNFENCKQQSLGNRKWIRFCGDSLDTNLTANEKYCYSDC
jgi:hypothetical protein